MSCVNDQPSQQSSNNLKPKVGDLVTLHLVHPFGEVMLDERVSYVDDHIIGAGKYFFNSDGSLNTYFTPKALHETFHSVDFSVV